MKPIGCVRLNAVADAVPPDATILISGPPRSGTSLAAAALHAGGLWVGDNIDHAVFEDLEFGGVAEPQAPWTTRLATARHHRAHWRLALRGFDIAGLRRRIEARNARFQRWGFKRPNMVPLLTNDVQLSLFRNPRLVMVFRDPVGLAERIALAEGMRFHNALYWAKRYLTANLRAARNVTVPTLLVGYEKANADRPAFFDEIFAFCGLGVPRDAYPRLGAAIDAAGTEYLRLAAAPNRGYLDGYIGGRLIGWCRTPGIDRPEEIDIYADDVKVASALADGFSADLLKAGFGDGRHRFSIPLDHLGLAEDCRIRAVIARTNVEIEKSGQHLGALRSHPGPPAAA